MPHRQQGSPNPLPPADDETLRLAKIGAPLRLAELESEREAIWNAFPELRPNGEVREVEIQGNQVRRRRLMTDDERAQHSKAMRAYWRKRRAAERGTR